MKAILKELIEKNREWTEYGHLAEYIPELKKANPDDLGITIVDLDGNIHSAGDYNVKFSIQSISKTVALLFALIQNGEDKVFSKVGKEPTGDPFNSIIKLETYSKRKPLNPMINAGAIAITSLIKGDSVEDKSNQLLDFFKLISNNNKLKFNEKIYKSEVETGDRNRSIAYFMKEMGNIDGKVDDVLDVYFKQCSIMVDCVDIANIGAVLANNGKAPWSEEQLIPEYYTKIAKSFMVTCGMYDGSGKFAIHVGIPAKSGVGGGILASVPHKFGIGVYGPALNRRGNSIAGIHLLEDLSKRLNLSIF